MFFFQIIRNMPFCVMPKNVAETILSKRIVVNEHSVLEFATELALSNANSRSSMGNRYSNRASTIMMNSSPRAIKFNPDKIGLMNQQPILSNISITNPFFDSQFPVIEQNIIKNCRIRS